MRGVLLAAFLVLLMAACTTDQEVVRSYLGLGVPVQGLDRHLEDRMQSLGIPGMSIVVLNRGEVVLHRVLGDANVARGIRVGESTLFEAASISKPVFVAFVMTYVDEGRLDLDRPLHEYLPYADIAHDERYRSITARMVLSHRSGFPNWRTDFADHQLFIAFEPGSDFLYSGEGYQYLALVLKELDGSTWEELDATFRQRVTAPLGMSRTVFMQDAASEVHKAEPYGPSGTWTNPENDPNRTLRFQFRAAASLHTEALDFSRWMMALSNRDVLSDTAFSEMLKPHSLVGRTSGIPIYYTLGFFHPRVPGTNLYFHGGNNGDFSSFFAIDVDRGWGFALFTNSAFGEELGNELLFHLIGGPRLGPVLALFAVSLGVGLVLLGVCYRRFVRRP